MTITPTKRRAIVALFMAGFSFREVGRLFRLPTLTVENVVREANHAARRRR